MKLSKSLFEDVIVYMLSEIGAMGPSGMLTCLKENGKSFTLDYLSDETPWEEVKENFAAINGCRFNGPMPHERLVDGEYKIGGRGEPTKINPGWKHMWLGLGHHLVCREEYFLKMKEILEGIDNCEITFDWVDILKKANFMQNIE